MNVFLKKTIVFSEREFSIYNNNNNNFSPLLASRLILCRFLSMCYKMSFTVLTGLSHYMDPPVCGSKHILDCP